VIAVLLAWLFAAQPAPPQSLTSGTTVRASLAGGESRRYSIDVPANHAAVIVARQEGIDVILTARPDGAALVHGLDMRAGIDGDETAFLPVAPTSSHWSVLVATALPKAARGDVVISVDIAPADEAARARAAAHTAYQLASDTAWGGDAVAFHAATTQYDTAETLSVAAGQPAIAAEALYQNARVADSLGDTPRAIELEQHALEMFRSLGFRDREARVLNRLGDLSRKVGDVIAAEQYFRDALPIARGAADPTNVADILNNSGLLMLTTSRYEEGIEQLQAAIPLAQDVDSANVEAALMLNIGDGYSRLGAYDRAIESYHRGYDVVQRLNLPRRSARSLNALARALFESGNTADAAETIDRAIALADKGGDQLTAAEAASFKGRMLYANGDVDGAVAHLTRALPALHAVQSRLAESTALTALARIDVDRGQPDAALVKINDALTLARQIGNTGAEQKALYVRALALRAQGRLDQAVASIDAVTDSVETARTAIQRTELRTSYLATVRGYFDLYIDLLQQKGDAAAAFAMSERARARSLLDGLAESAAKIRKGVDPELLARQRVVQAQLNAKEAYRAQVALKDGETSRRAAALTHEVAALLDDWNDLRAKIRSSSPAYAQLEAPEPVTADRVQHTLLDPGSVLVEYHLGDAHSYVWTVDRSSITSRELPAAHVVDRVARAYHEAVSQDPGSLTADERAKRSARIRSLGTQLASMVWKPIEARVANRRILIVADGVLQYIPFAALPASTGEPLIAAHEIAYLPSASVLESIRQRSRPIATQPAIAVFADPVFSRNDPRFNTERDAGAPSRSRASDGGTYGRLRFSRDEANAIDALSPGAFTALDFAATKPAFTARDLRKYRILHVATHGSLNASQPDLSGLVFSLVDSSGKPIDGFLRLHEIYNLDLDADLVVLSACRTALGREVYGEGLIGLTRGFMYAGASRVVSSVWNVDDRASAQLMARFYDAMLSRRLAPAHALRDAQLAMLRRPRWADPHYWAAFGLQGDWK